MIGCDPASRTVSSLPVLLEGFGLEHHAVIGSTNDRALALARSGQDRVWVIADQQQGGRGRNGRVWVSPQGNLYASLSLVDPCAMISAPQLGFVAGLAILEAVDSCIAGGQRLAIKWPNDLLLDGAKVSGLLLEGGMSGAHFALTIGIGLNLVAHPADTPYRATDLRTAGFDVARADILTQLSQSMQRWLGLWDRGQGFASVRSAWLARAAFLGEPITVSLSGKKVDGLFQTLDPQGRLVLAAADGPIVIDAGDVYPFGQHDGPNKE